MLYYFHPFEKANLSSTGRVFLWGKLIDESWSVTRIELELTKHPGKRLLIKNGPKNDTEAEQ